MRNNYYLDTIKNILVSMLLVSILSGCQGESVPEFSEADSNSEQSLSQNIAVNILGEDAVSGSSIEGADREEDRQVSGENPEEKPERRQYTQEDLEAAWDSRLGNYGILLTALPEVKAYEEVYEIQSRNASNLLTINGMQMEGDEYASINAGLAEMMEEEKMRYETEGIDWDTSAYLYVCRLDGRVISVKNSEHLLLFENAATFDMTTGEQLECADLFSDKDTAEALIAEDLVKQVENSYDWYFHNSNEIKEQCIEEAESFTFENKDDYQWYLDGESMVVTVIVGEHHYVSMLPYREYAYLFCPQYLPGDGIAYYRSNNTGKEHIEFNGVIAEGVELMESDPSCDYSEQYPDVVGYYINDGTEEYLCISVLGIYDFEHRSYLCRFTENGIEALKESEGISAFYLPGELQERIKAWL